MSKLTEFEKEMHKKLCEQRWLMWSETSNQQTQALNRLIKKGLASYDGETKSWMPIEFTDAELDRLRKYKEISEKYGMGAAKLEKLVSCGFPVGEMTKEEK